MESVTWIILCVLYFLPYIVADCRKKKNKIAIFVLNLIAGWTGIGYVVAMVWAWMKD